MQIVHVFLISFLPPHDLKSNMIGLPAQKQLPNLSVWSYFKLQTSYVIWNA